MEKINSLIWSYIFLPGLAISALVLSVRCSWLQFRRFGHAMSSTVGRAFRRGEGGSGSITPLQAASTALAATVGTGNIVGTAQAIAMGGRGAVFWLWAAAALGMIIKYAEIYLGIRYRAKNRDGSYVGGPMYYIRQGLGRRFRTLAALYAFFAALSVLGMGNMCQINSSVGAITDTVKTFAALSAEDEFRLRLTLGAVLAILIFVILSGGAARVGRVTEILVPFMGLAFLLFTAIVLVCHADRLIPTLRDIVCEAFRPKAALGAAGGLGFASALHWGVRRGAFSNEAGLGTAAIAHAPAQADSPSEHGLWGIFEVFADTVVICTATALAILCSGTDIPWGTTPGPELLQSAFSTVFGVRCASLFMSLTLSLFAYSTVIGCSIYGIRCVQYLFGECSGNAYRLVFSICAVLGSVMSTTFIWTAADTVNALMALPNFIALIVLSKKIGIDTRKQFFDNRRQ